MKVILTQSVQGVGKAGELHNVADGYARNYLIPRRLAVEASKGNLRNLEKIQAEATQREAAARAAAEKVLAAVEGLRITIPARVSPDGSKLYGAITAAEIAKNISAISGQEIEKRMVLSEPIKSIGGYRVPVRVYAGLTGTVTVVVYPEGQQPPAEEQPVEEAAAPEPAPAPAPAAQAPAEPESGAAEAEEEEAPTGLAAEFADA
jgi:large subunit ribosomal protein L9